MRSRVLLVFVSLVLFGFAPAPFPRPDRQQREDQTDVGGTLGVRALGMEWSEAEGHGGDLAGRVLPQG